MLLAWLVAWVVAWSPLPAEGRRPVATLQGQFRNFSPDGRLAVVQEGEGLRIYDTATWKPSPLLAPRAARSGDFPSICVDNDGKVAACRPGELQILDFRGEPKVLCAIRNTPTFAAFPVLSGNRLLVKVVAIPRRPTASESLRLTKIILLMRTKVNYAYFAYRIASFSVPLGTVVERCLDGGADRLAEPEALEALRRQAVGGVEEWIINDNRSRSGNGSEAVLKPVQLTDRIWRFKITYQTVSAASCESGTVSECPYWGSQQRMFTAQAPAYDQQDTSRSIYLSEAPYELRGLKGRGCALEKSGPDGGWRLIPRGPDALPPFALDFTPTHTSMDGRWIAGTRGSEAATLVFAAEVLADPYADYAPDILQDLLLTKIIGLMKAGNSGAALPYFRRLEHTGVAQPQSFYYYRMKALEDTGRRAEARTEAEAYLQRHGKKGEYYAEVIALLGRLQG
jgi:hypothetical protein